MSAVLDTVGGPATEGAADLLITAGVVAAVPTAASGLNDWSDTHGPETRVGLVHAALNTTALSLYLASLIARARGRRRGGKALGLAGLGVLTGGGYLGGHLSFVKGVNVNRTAWEQPPHQWTPVLADAELADGTARKADAGGPPVLLYRTAGQVHALASTCSHMGGPLEEGTISDGCVTCPWHGSTFRFADGTIVRGPSQHAAALLPDAHPGLAHRDPRRHLGGVHLRHLVQARGTQADSAVRRKAGCAHRLLVNTAAAARPVGVSW